jgi:Protein of unknown function (DUF2946)
MRAASTPCMRLPAGQARRSAAWVVALALVVQGVLGAAMTLRMWGGVLDPLGIAGGICIDPSSAAKGPAGQEQSPVGSAQDHDHCLLCNAGLLAGMLPIQALLPVPLGVESAPIARARFAAVGRVASRHRPRGPPILA